jgi:hypothetical protein
MLRKLVASLVVVALVAGVAVAAAGKKGKKVTGTVKTVDAAAGTLTVVVKHKKQTADKDFTIPDEAKVVVGQGKENKESTGKAGLKDAQIKEGVLVTVLSDADGKVVEVRFGDAAKGKHGHGVAGVFKNASATSGVLTLTVKHKKATADKDFTITETTKFVIFGGTQKQEITGKEGLKSDQLKDGARVIVNADKDGKAALVRIGTPAKGAKGKKGKDAPAAHGTLKKADPATGTVTVTVKMKKELVDKDFTLADGTKVVVFDGADKKEFTGKEGLKNDQVKEGAKVAVVSDADGKLRLVRIGTPPKKAKK